MYVRLHLCAVATWDKGQAEFRCRQCGALHHSTFKDLPSRARVPGEHFCEGCGTTTTGKSSAYVPLNAKPRTTHRSLKLNSLVSPCARVPTPSRISTKRRLSDTCAAASPPVRQ